VASFLEGGDVSLGLPDFNGHKCVGAFGGVTATLRCAYFPFFVLVFAYSRVSFLRKRPIGTQ